MDDCITPENALGILHNKIHQPRQHCSAINSRSRSLVSQSDAKSVRCICKHVVLKLSHNAVDVTPRPPIVSLTPSLSCNSSASRMYCAASSYRYTGNLRQSTQIERRRGIPTRRLMQEIPRLKLTCCDAALDGE